MKKLLLLAIAFGLGFWTKYQDQSLPDKDFPVTSRKSFVFIVYAHNDAVWVQRSMQSLLEQEYDYYRIVFIDDGSVDSTFSLARRFIEQNEASDKVLWVQNVSKQGFLSCLYHAALNTLDQEILVPIYAKDWLAHSGVLTRINTAYQNPDVWRSVSYSLSFPSYEKSSQGLDSFYAALFKGVSLDDWMKFSMEPLKKASEGRSKILPDVLVFSNES